MQNTVRQARLAAVAVVDNGQLTRFVQMFGRTNEQYADYSFSGAVFGSRWTAAFHSAWAQSATLGKKVWYSSNETDSGCGVYQAKIHESTCGG